MTKQRRAQLKIQHAQLVGKLLANQGKSSDVKALAAIFDELNQFAEVIAMLDADVSKAVTRAKAQIDRDKQTIQQLQSQLQQQTSNAISDTTAQQVAALNAELDALDAADSGATPAVPATGATTGPAPTPTTPAGGSAAPTPGPAPVIPPGFGQPVTTPPANVGAPSVPTPA